MRPIALLIIVFLPLVIFCVNFTALVFNKNVYLAIFENNGIYSNFQTKDESIYLTDNLLGHFRGKNLLEQNFFSTQAVLHLSDIKDIIGTVKMLSLVLSISTAVSIIIFFYTQKFHLFSKILFRGSLLLVILTFLISSLFIFNFSLAFEKLHLILFRNNLWLFDASDSLIKLFPESFFVNFTIILVTNIIITAFSLFVLSQVFKDYD